MAIVKPNFTRSDIQSPTADFAKTLSAFGTDMVKEANKNELLQKQDARQALQDARQNTIWDRQDEEYARKKQDLAANDIYRKVVGGESQYIPEGVSDAYKAGTLKLPELSGAGVQTPQESREYLAGLVNGTVEKRQAPVLTPEQQAVETAQADWANKILNKDVFKETELDKLNRAFGAIEDAGYKVPSNLIDKQLQAKAIYQAQAETDRKALQSKLAAYDKNKADLLMDKAKEEYKFAKDSGNIGKTKTSTGKGDVTSALTSLYAEKGSPGAIDAESIQNKLLASQKELDVSNATMAKAIEMSKFAYDSSWPRNVNETSLVENVKKLISDPTFNAGTSSKLKSSPTVEAINARLAKIEANKAAAMAGSGTPEEKRDAIMQESLKPYQLIRNDINDVTGTSVIDNSNPNSSISRSNKDFKLSNEKRGLNPGVSENFNKNKLSTEGDGSWSQISPTGAKGPWQQTSGYISGLNNNSTTADKIKKKFGRTYTRDEIYAMDEKAGRPIAEFYNKIGDEDNINSLTNTKTPVNDTTLYMAHNIGPATTAKIYRGEKLTEKELTKLSKQAGSPKSVEEYLTKVVGRNFDLNLLNVSTTSPLTKEKTGRNDSKKTLLDRLDKSSVVDPVSIELEKKFNAGQLSPWENTLRKLGLHKDQREITNNTNRRISIKEFRDSQLKKYKEAKEAQKMERIKENPDVIKGYRAILNSMARKQGYIGTGSMPDYSIEQYIIDNKLYEK